MNKTDITEYADFLLNAAMCKCSDYADAQDLAQDTLLAALTAMKKGRIENPGAWLTAVLNRKYYDLLRRKYNKPTVSFDVAAEIPARGEVYEDIEKTEEAEEIRRCLAYLSRLYREVMVRHYMHGEKVADIAAALGVPENTVKSRLNSGRKRMEKEFAMEKFSKNSYEPDMLFLSSAGRHGVNNEPFSLIENDNIVMNLLIMAYAKPVTVTELSKAIGIPTAYIEPIADRLLRGELMKRTGDKVYTDFIIYTDRDRTAGCALEEETAQRIYKDVWQIMSEGFKWLHGMDYYKRQTLSAQTKLDSFFAVRTVQRAVIEVRDEAAGGAMPFEEYPDRPNGGKWLAMGSHYPAGYDFGSPRYQGKYNISGECHSSCVVSLNGGKKETLHLCEFNTLLGSTQLGSLYGSRNKMKHPMTDMEIAQMLYAIHLGREDELPVINAGCFENFDILLKSRYIEKQEGKTVCAVPVMTDKERWEMYDLSRHFTVELTEKFHGDFMQLMKDPVKLPSHLKSVPPWQQYMLCGTGLPMRMIVKARDNGLFPECADYPAPAILISAEG